MFTKPSKSIKEEDFIFENTPIRIVARRNCPEITLSGLRVGPLEEGKEYEVRFWVACELEKAGISRFREEELLGTVKLHKIHWKERVQSVRDISSLSKTFYPQLRRYLAGLEEESFTKPEKLKENEQAMKIARDIVNCRLKKIVSLASTPGQTSQIIRNLTEEERVLYTCLSEIITDWRSKILLEGE